MEKDTRARPIGASGLSIVTETRKKPDKRFLGINFPGQESACDRIIDARGNVVMDEYMDPAHLRTKDYDALQQQRLVLATDEALKFVNDKYPLLNASKSKMRTETFRDSLTGLGRELIIDLKRKKNILFYETLASFSVENSAMCLHQIECKEPTLALALQYFSQKPFLKWRFNVRETEVNAFWKSCDGGAQHHHRIYPVKEGNGWPLIHEDFAPLFLLGKDCAFQTPESDASYVIVAHLPNKRDDLIVNGADKSLDDLFQSFKGHFPKAVDVLSAQYGSVEQSHQYYPTEAAPHVYFPWLKPVSPKEVGQFERMLKK